MALSMDEERMLAEIERRLADDDPALAARLTSFRLPRLGLAPRSARGRLTASLLMLVVVAAVSVFVYTLMPFRGQEAGNTAGGGSAATHPSMSAGGAATSPDAIRPAARTSSGAASGLSPASGRTASSASPDAYGK